MRPARLSALGTLLVLALATSTSATAGTPTAHRLSFQGLAKDASNQPVYSGDVRVRVYSAATAGTLVYDSDSEFNGAVVTGVFNVVLGSGTPLMLDNTLQYYLELDINGQEVVGDAASGRQAFWPAGGDVSRPDLEGRIAALEAQVFAVCDPNEYDLNGTPADGCEFVLDPNGIYVDANDPSGNDLAGCGRGPNNTAPGCVPCRSIGRGLIEAQSTGRTTVYVANGTYLEAVTLINGKNLLGGFESLTWERNVAATNTIIRGESVVGNHKRTVVGTGITSPTNFDGFVVYGPMVSAVSGNSYAFYLTNCGGLALTNNVILGGNGGPGLDGGAGPDGGTGAGGTAGANAAQSPTTGCSPTLNRSGGAGGVGGGANGGAGGGNNCPVVANSESSGRDGIAGPAGGAGGDAGEDGAFNGVTCTLPTGAGTRMDGANGSNGAVGTNGSAVGGASNGLGTVASSNWIGLTGNAGNSGTVGRGGGGGGAGGGSDASSPDLDIVGATGGGGGAGGTGGAGGNPGTAGGGAFGIFILGGTAPTITTNTIYRGTGGVGGRGGNGGKGGAGGLGAAGGGQGSLFCSGVGGRGGDGGLGGHGSGAGGSAGGISCGIFTSGIGSPAYGGANTFSGGAGGTGGVGGASLGSVGGIGVAGTLSTVTSQ